MGAGGIAPRVFRDERRSQNPSESAAFGRRDYQLPPGEGGSGTEAGWIT
jgi:hypothetical protein